MILFFFRHAASYNPQKITPIGAFPNATDALSEASIVY